MNTKITFITAVFILLLVIIACSPPTTILEFTFANEAQFDTTLTAEINGNQVYEKELVSYVTAGGYFGQEFEYVSLETPAAEFSLTVQENQTGLTQSMMIDPSKGKYVSVTFWEGRLIIGQHLEKPMRID